MTKECQWASTVYGKGFGYMNKIRSGILNRNPSSKSQSMKSDFLLVIDKNHQCEGRNDFAP